MDLVGSPSPVMRPTCHYQTLTVGLRLDTLSSMASPLPFSGADSPHRDPVRWDALVDAMSDAMLVTIGRWMRGKLERFCSAEDIWQETLVHAWSRRENHAWEGARKYRAWLLAIARGRIQDAVDRMEARKRGGDREVEQLSLLAGDDGTRLSAILPGRSTTPSVVASHREAARLMEEALAGLPEELQEVVHLRLFEELAMEEVARRLDLPTSTAWNRFRKGLEQYAQKLDGLRSVTRLRPDKGGAG